MRPKAKSPPSGSGGGVMPSSIAAGWGGQPPDRKFTFSSLTAPAGFVTLAFFGSSHHPEMIAKKIFLTKGVGKHRERLSSFELALRDAGIAACNLVRVSSIFPPRCKLIPRAIGLKSLSPGEV